MHDIKVYLTQHEMLGQSQFQKDKDPYDPETYRPYLQGQFDGEGRPIDERIRPELLYWLMPIYRTPTGELKNTCRSSTPGRTRSTRKLEWRAEQLTDES